jgi:hypothetical protein
MSTITKPTTGPGSQMGTKSRAILECLRKNGRKNRLDLEMLLSIGPLSAALSRLSLLAYVVKASPSGVDSGIYDITRQGRQALGEALDLPEPKTVRFCNASTTGPYIPSIHNTSRIGVARS